MSAARTGRLTVVALVSLLATMPSQAKADTPYLSLTTVASAPVAVPGAPETYTGTVTPVGGTFAGVSIAIRTYATPTNCVPASCTIDAYLNDVTWTFAEITSPVAFSIDSTAAPGTAIGYRVQACDPNDCLVQQQSVTVLPPTVTVNLTYSPSGTIMPGDVLHFTVSGSANAGPVPGDLQANFYNGLADPTAVGCGTWSPAPYGYIDCNTSLDLTKKYSFDTVVTATVGSTLKIETIFYPTLFQVLGTLTKTLTLHVGPTATPTPTAAPASTPAPTHVATAAPTAQPPSSSVAAAASVAESTVPSPSAAASFTASASTVSDGSSSAEPSSSPDPDVSSGRPVDLTALLVATGTGAAAAVGVAGLWMFRRRRGGL